MIQTRFSDPAEFIHEMGEDAAGQEIARRIVRLTQTFDQDHKVILITWLTVVATYLTTSGQIVRLQAPIGDLWHNTMHRDESEAEYNHEKFEKANAMMAQVRQAAEVMGMEVRGGILEEVEA